MANFHFLRVIDICHETADAVSVAFEVPEKLRALYKFIQGQYITIKINIDGNDQRRSYSLSISPYEQMDLRITVKEVYRGKVSTYINHKLKIGDYLEVMPPMGTFYSELSENNKKNYVFFAGGSGITPIMSLLKSILYLERQSIITLFYASKNESNTIFKSTLDFISSNSENLEVVYIYEQPAEGSSDFSSGRLTHEKTILLLEKFNGSQADEYFICGPLPMMEIVKGSLESMAIPKKKIHIEYFSAVADAVQQAENASPDNSSSEVKIIYRGVETSIDLAANDMSILDASLQAGIEPPYSCKAGICNACRAKIIAGKVSMNENFALNDEELAEGYVLACQAHPISDLIIINFDI